MKNMDYEQKINELIEKFKEKDIKANLKGTSLSNNAC